MQAMTIIRSLAPIAQSHDINWLLVAMTHAMILKLDASSLMSALSFSAKFDRNQAIQDISGCAIIDALPGLGYAAASSLVNRALQAFLKSGVAGS